MDAQVLDNRLKGSVADFFRKELGKGTSLSALVTWFTVYAYEELKPQLHKVSNFRLLLKPDKNSEPGKRLFCLPQEYRFRNQLNLKYVAQDCAKWLAERGEVHELPPDNMCPHLAIVNHQDGRLTAIQGSLDLSTVGLGILPTKLPTFSMPIHDTSAVSELLAYFDEYWDSYSTNITQEILDYLNKVAANQPPELLYYFVLYNVFREFAEDASQRDIIRRKAGLEDSAVWNMLYNFQRDAVIGAIRKLEKHGGCIIADSVGLGKTFEALAVIKYYELRNNRVLVLTPKKLRDNWLVYRQNDKRNLLVEDRFNYDVLNHTDLSRAGGMSGDINLETVNWGNYDLLVIDESHNFRNNPAVKDRQTRYQKLMQDIIKSGVKTKVLMLSATPVNNRMSDLKNQIAFITEGKDDALKDTVGISSIDRTLREAQKRFNLWSELGDSERTTQRFLDMVGHDYFMLLDALTIARSRKHIQKYYDTASIGQFPERLRPLSIKADIDDTGCFPPISDINNEIMRLNLAIYSPLQYLRIDKVEEYAKKYDTLVQDGKGSFSAAQREISLTALMRTNMLKRMESSIVSFKLTVSKILAGTEQMIQMVESSNDMVEMNISDIDFDDPEIEDLTVGSKVKVLIADLDKHKILDALYEDRERLRDMVRVADKVTPSVDAKLNTLKELITRKIEQPLNAGNRKVIVFTAFSDTAEYLYAQLSGWALNQHNIYSALVTGSTSCKTTMAGIGRQFDSVLTHFSPHAKNRDKIYPGHKEEIDLLIATDCISEGQNLQDCDYLINYDIHWNPVRIIQRFGRIDRLGSQNKRIQLVNFWPNMALDEYIRLEARVKDRMVLLNVSATGEEDLIHYTGKNSMNDLEYRRKQLEQLQQEVVDLEDINGSISITDLTLEDLRLDLLNYMDHTPGLLESLPAGLHAVVETNLDLPEGAEGGVIFCLREVSSSSTIRKYGTSLQPYHLVYLSNDGSIKIGSSDPKGILDFTRAVCTGKCTADPHIYQIFEQETKHGKNMSAYQELLQIAVQHVSGMQEEHGLASLFSLGGTSGVTQLPRGTNDYEVIAWLVVVHG